MENQGSLGNLSISTLFQQLINTQKSGTLTISVNNERRSVGLKNGILISLYSEMEREQFEYQLLKMGLITQTEVSELIVEAREKNTTFPELVVAQGFISDEEAYRLSIQSSVRILENILNLKEGTYEFHPDITPVSGPYPLPLFIHQLTFDSAAKRKQWIKIHDLLRRFDITLRHMAAGPGNLANLTDFEQHVLVQCNQPMSIFDLCIKARTIDFDTFSAIATLINEGWINIETPNTEHYNKTMHECLWYVMILLDQKRFLTATQELDRLKKEHGDLSYTNMLTDQIKTMIHQEMNRLFRSDEVKPSLVPDMDIKQIKNHHFKPEEWFVYSRINGQITLKDLYRITGIGKEATQMAIYTLITLGAVSLRKEMESSGEFRAITNRGNVDTSTPKTGEYSVPDRYLNKKSGIDEAPAEKKTIDIKELDAIYASYLKKNHYEVLNILMSASPDEIREAYIKLVKEYHPDMYFSQLPRPVQERLGELFSLVNHAHRVLSNPVSRKRYDEQLWANQKSSSRTVRDLIPRSETPKSSPIPNPEPVIRPESGSKPAPKTKPEPPAPSTPPVKPKPTPEPSPKPKPEKTETHEKKPAPTDLEKMLKDDKGTDGPKWKQLLNEGIEHCEGERFKQAIQPLEEALKLNTREPKIYYLLSRAYLQLGGEKNIEESLNNIKRAIILDKENPLFFCQIARTYLASRLFSEAEKYAKTALAWDSDSKEAKKVLADIKEASKGGFLKGLIFGKKRK